MLGKLPGEQRTVAGHRSNAYLALTQAILQKGRVMKSIFDSSFEYTPSHETDLRKTFARIRREQQAHTQEQQQTQMPGAAAIPTFVQLKRAGARSVLEKTHAR